VIEKAVVDRFKGKLAVLLVGDARWPVNVQREVLPKTADEGHWLRVELEGDQVLNAMIDHEETARAKLRLEKLARRRRMDQESNS
jgi:hypothetical protein